MTLEQYTVEHSLSVSCDRPGCGLMISVEADSLTDALDAIKDQGWRLEPSVAGFVLTSCEAFCPRHDSADIQCDGCLTVYAADAITTRTGGDWCARCLEEREAVYVEAVPIQPGSGLTQTATATLCGQCNTRIAVPVPIPAKFDFERQCPQCGQACIITAEPDGDGAKLFIRGKVEEVKG